MLVRTVPSPPEAVYLLVVSRSGKALRAEHRLVTSINGRSCSSKGNQGGFAPQSQPSKPDPSTSDDPTAGPSLRASSVQNSDSSSASQVPPGQQAGPVQACTGTGPPAAMQTVQSSLPSLRHHGPTPAIDVTSPLQAGGGSASDSKVRQMNVANAASLHTQQPSRQYGQRAAIRLKPRRGRRPAPANAPAKGPAKACMKAAAAVISKCKHAQETMKVKPGLVEANAFKSSTVHHLVRDDIYLDQSLTSEYGSSALHVVRFLSERLDLA